MEETSPGKNLEIPVWLQGDTRTTEIHETAEAVSFLDGCFAGRSSPAYADEAAVAVAGVQLKVADVFDRVLKRGTAEGRGGIDEVE